ncbi:MAG: peroxiredoxin family protein [Phycisphaerales bacterium JB039]
MELAEKYKSLEDRFEILAFHDASAKTLEELDEKLEPIIRDRWGGKELPFPILMDATGATIKGWGISAFPTVVLIDPDGNLVRGGGEKMLEEILAKMAAEQAEQPGPGNP